MNTEEFRKEVLLTLRAIAAALGDVADAIKGIPASKPPSSRRGPKS